MAVYSIGGNNFVWLRDIDKAVNFGIPYNVITNSNHIGTNQPYYEVRTQLTVTIMESQRKVCRPPL